MGSPFGLSVFSFPLDLDRRITLAFGFCSFRWAPRSGDCACHLFLGWASSLASVLLFSVWLHYDLSVFFFLVSSLTRLVGLFFATVSSLAILDSCRSLLPRSFSSSRVSFAVWLVLRSLGGLLCSFGLAPFSFWFGRSFRLSRVFCYLS